MEWLTSPRRFRPAFEFLQKVVVSPKSKGQSPKDSEAQGQDRTRGDSDRGSEIDEDVTSTSDRSSGLLLVNGSSGSASSSVDDKRPRSESLFEDSQFAQQTRSFGKTKALDINDSRSSDSVFDDVLEGGITHRRHTVAQGSVSSTGSVDSQRSSLHGVSRKQGSLTIHLPSTEILQRTQPPAPPRSPRLLRVDQFDKALYRNAEPKVERQDENPVLGRISTHVAYDVDTRTLRLALISTSWLSVTLNPVSPSNSLLPSPLQPTQGGSSMPPSAASSPANLRHSVCLQVTLMPDRMTKQSAVQRCARSIQWKEELLFTLDAETQLSNVCEKWVQVVFTEFDRATRPIGVAECRIELGKLDLLRGESTTTPLTKCTPTVASCGQLLVSLHHLPNAGRLNVDVLQAKGLLKRTKGKNLDTYVKVVLSDTQGRCCKSKKTAVVRNCSEPQFNETLVFDTNAGRSEPELFFDCHTVSVYLYASSCSITERDELIGRVLFGPSKYASGEVEKESWMQLKAKTHVKDWYDLCQPARFGSDSEKSEKVRLSGAFSMLN